MRAHRQVLNALRGTQQEQGQKIDGLVQKIGGLGQRIDGLERELRGGFTMQATGMAQLTALLTKIAGPE